MGLLEEWRRQVSGYRTNQELTGFIQCSDDGLLSKLRVGAGPSESENLNANQTANRILGCPFLRAEGSASGRSKSLKCPGKTALYRFLLRRGVEDFPINVDGANFFS